MDKTKLLILEDEPLVAAMIREALLGTSFTVTATAFDKEQALKLLSKEKFNAAILDINLNGKHDGIEVGRLIRDKYKMPFLFLTAHADDRTLNNAKLTEPAGYIVKPFTERELLAGLEIAMYNYKKRKATPYDVPNFEKLNHNLIDPITQREIDVLELLYDGKSNIEMADKLYVSRNTIKTHLTRLFSKFSVRSRTELMARIRFLANKS